MAPIRIQKRWYRSRLPQRLGLIAATLMLAACASDSRQQWTELQQLHEAAAARFADGGAQGAVALDDEPQLPERPSVDDLIAYALRHSPALEASFNEWAAAIQRVPQARSLMDPQLSYVYFVESDMDRQALSLSQAFPWFGKLGLREKIAMREARASELRFESQRLAVINNVRQAYGELAYVDAALQIVEDIQQQAQASEQSARARLEAGQTPFADVIAGQVQIARLDDEIAALRDLRQPAIVQLNAAMGRPAEAALPMPQPLDPPDQSMPDEAQVLAMLRQSNPELLAMREQTAGQREAVRLARKATLPDFMLGVEYMDKIANRDAVGLMAGINLPIWRQRYDAERREALGNFNAALYGLVARQRDLEAELAMVHYRLRDAQRKLDLFGQQLVPLARQSVAAQQAAYAADDAEFKDLAEAQATLLEFELTYQRALVDWHQRFSQLDMIVGGKLMNLPDSEFDEPGDAPGEE